MSRIIIDLLSEPEGDRPLPNPLDIAVLVVGGPEQQFSYVETPDDWVSIAEGDFLDVWKRQQR